MMNKGVNVRISGKLLSFVEQQTSAGGMYESASEYIRDLVRRDYERQQQHKWQQLYKELADGIHADKSEFIPLNMDSIIDEAKNEKT